MDLISIAIGAVVCIAIGAWGHRYWLKRDPAKLERWAAEIKAAGQRAKF